MKDLRWEPAKNEWLKEVRGVSFEELLMCKLIKTVKNDHRPHQKLFLFERNDYVWVVPFVRQEATVFLKTAYPSRKFTRMYLRGELP